jgi:hypothetical protein
VSLGKVGDWDWDVSLGKVGDWDWDVSLGKVGDWDIPSQVVGCACLCMNLSHVLSNVANSHIGRGDGGVPRSDDGPEAQRALCHDLEPDG